MKNFEKFEKEIMEIVREGYNIAIQNGLPIRCQDILCVKCDFYGIGEQCRDKRREWMESEYKERPKLNKYERALCEALQTGWIARDKNGSSYWFRDKPARDFNDTWFAKNSAWFRISGTVGYANPKIHFDFIKWEDEEPWSVKELLELEVEE